MYTQYPIIRNGDQRWLVEFLKKYWFLDIDGFLFIQASLVTVSKPFLKFFQKKITKKNNPFLGVFILLSF